ncbi:MAG: SDR family oxidoreductase [Paludibacteraceae bacterium]|nr:SDR family oxidoreductase [Paludibacteraceae bacterium]
MTHNLLDGKRGIIFGALNSKSLAWAVAKQCVAEGAKLVLTNTPIALRLGQIQQLAQETHSAIITADATNTDDLQHLFIEAQNILDGKIDFVLHAVAMSQNIRRGKAYQEADYNYMQQTLDISALSFHKLLQTAYQLDALNEYASVVALTYIAAQRAFQGYNDMADAKALLESIARNFGMIYGRQKRVRINTVSQSPTPTTAGTSIGNGVDRFFEISDHTSPLGNANQQDCANFCVILFSDYTRKVTMQNLYHDGGFSTTGIQLP